MQEKVLVEVDTPEVYYCLSTTCQYRAMVVTRCTCALAQMTE